MSSIENLSSGKKLAILVGVSLGLLILLIAIFELLAYLWLQIDSPKHNKNLSLTEFLLTKPLPFAKADDYGEIKKEFAGETNCPKNRIINNPVTGFPRYEISSFSCNGPVTMRDGLRTTVGNVNNPKNKILFFGGSTMWGTGSADRNTIPSIVQQQIVSGNFNYAVENHGFASVVISQQVKQLKSTPITKGDIVVFYDGGNDVWNSVVYGNPHGGIIGYNDSNYGRIMLNRAKFLLSTYSNVYQLIGGFKGRLGADRKRCDELSASEVDTRASVGFNIYFDRALEAKNYVEASGGYFLHFFQPSLVSSSPLSKYKSELIASMADETRCGIDAFSKGYDIYKRKYLNVKSQISGNDLTVSLDSSTSEDEYFWDYIHVSSPGNKVIAGRIYDTLAAKLTN